MNRKREELTPEKVWGEFGKGRRFNEGINLDETVKVNEDFFIGRQWEGVKSNGLPTPVFNLIKRIVLYQVATTAADNIAMSASPLGLGGAGEETCAVVKDQFDALIEQCKLGKEVRGFMRDAAVRGDGCFYSWFDREAETGQEAMGALRLERLENTRVFFGDPNVREVQEQPYILISRRERLDKVRQEAEENGQDADAVKSERDEAGDRFDALADDKVTTLTRFEKRDGTVWWSKTVKDAVVQQEKDTGMKLYPLVWMNWERVSNSYHGQAAVTGLIPNQIFINKAQAMTYISLMTTAYPKVIYDKRAVDKWDGGVGKAIGVDGGGRSLNDVAKILEPAVISPNVSQFIDKAADMTKELNGATDAALGNVRPDNTSAIIALQKASGVPMELVRQDLYQALEDLGRVWLDQMRCYYGTRYVRVSGADGAEGYALFDFAGALAAPMSLKLDVGVSAYWSELTQISTLENLLVQGKITTAEFLERMPGGYITRQEELIKAVRARELAAVGGMAGGPPLTPEEELPAQAGMGAMIEARA